MDDVSAHLVLGLEQELLSVPQPEENKRRESVRRSDVRLLRYTGRSHATVILQTLTRRRYRDAFCLERSLSPP